AQHAGHDAHAPQNRLLYLGLHQPKSVRHEWLEIRHVDRHEIRPRANRGSGDERIGLQHPAATGGIEQLRAIAPSSSMSGSILPERNACANSGSPSASGPSRYSYQTSEQTAAASPPVTRL